jgi:hypothetical protein
MLDAPLWRSDCSGSKVAGRILRLGVGFALILLDIGFLRPPALADDASVLIGRWLVPSREQRKSRMSPQCQQHADTDPQTVPESEIEIFSCNDPAFAPQKTRILEFVICMCCENGSTLCTSLSHSEFSTH